MANNEKIFVSYSSENTRFVREEILPRVKEAKHDTWFAPKSIGGGADWRMKLLDGLDTCDRVLVVVSKESQESAYVKLEISHAAKKLLAKKARIDARLVHRAILPVVLDERGPYGEKPDSPLAVKDPDRVDVDPYLLHAYLTLVNFIALPNNEELNKWIDPKSGRYTGDELALSKEQLESVNDYVRDRAVAHERIVAALRNPELLKYGFTRFARLIAFLLQPATQRVGLAAGIVLLLTLLHGAVGLWAHDCLESLDVAAVETALWTETAGDDGSDEGLSITVRDEPVRLRIVATSNAGEEQIKYATIRPALRGPGGPGGPGTPGGPGGPGTPGGPGGPGTPGGPGGPGTPGGPGGPGTPGGPGGPGTPGGPGGPGTPGGPGGPGTPGGPGGPGTPGGPGGPGTPGGPGGPGTPGGPAGPGTPGGPGGPGTPGGPGGPGTPDGPTDTEILIRTRTRTELVNIKETLHEVRTRVVTITEKTLEEVRVQVDETQCDVDEATVAIEQVRVRYHHTLDGSESERVREIDRQISEVEEVVRVMRTVRRLTDLHPDIKPHLRELVMLRERRRKALAEAYAANAPLRKQIAETVEGHRNKRDEAQRKLERLQQIELDLSRAIEAAIESGWDTAGVETAGGTELPVTDLPVTDLPWSEQSVYQQVIEVQRSAEELRVLLEGSDAEANEVRRRVKELAEKRAKGAGLRDWDRQLRRELDDLRWRLERLKGDLHAPQPE